MEEDIETGVEQPEAAAPEAQGEPESPPASDDLAPAFDAKVEQAFAKRLAAEREKLRRELEAELASQHYMGAGQESSGQQDPAEMVAERLGTTPEMARVLMGIWRQTTEAVRRQQEMAEEAEAQRLKATDPDFDRQAAEAVREEFRRLYGVTLSLEHAWAFASREKKLEAAKREAEQRALAQVALGKKASTGPAESGFGKVSFHEMPDDEFERVVAQVKAGGRLPI